MPEPGSSPSNESPNSSEFFNAEGIVSSLQSAKKAEDETAEATQVTAKNTQGILDIIKGDIGKAVEKIIWCEGEQRGRCCYRKQKSPGVLTNRLNNYIT